jgi:hypothetical protein
MTKGRRLVVAAAGAQRLLLCLLGLGLLALTCGSVSARSDVVRERGGWTIERVFAASGVFQGCGATVTSSGWRIGLAHSADGTWEMLFSRPRRPFEAGARYGVSLSAGRRLIYRGVAEVLPSGLAFLAPELSEGQVVSIGRAGRLEYATGRGRKTLSLSGAQDAIQALRACVVRNAPGTGVAGDQRDRLE